MAHLKPVLFRTAESTPLALEGLLHLPAGGGPRPAAVVCHPHPLGGGTMHNAVVAAIARSLAERGIVALRFNFRGLGRSEGQHDYGRGERADVAGALDWLLSQPEVDPQRLSVVGYSFGAWVGLSQAQDDPRLAAAVGVALTAWHFDAAFARSHALPELGADRWTFDPAFLQSFRRPKLLVSGEFDSFAPLSAVRNFVSQLPPPKTLHIVRGADHFFGRQEVTVGRVVAEFIAGL